MLQNQATAASSVTWFCKRLLATFFTIPGQVEQKEPVAVPPDPNPPKSLKNPKRGRSGSTPNLKQTDSKPVVTNEKRNSLAVSTLPRMSTPKQQQDFGGETNGLVTLPRQGAVPMHAHKNYGIACL